MKTNKKLAACTSETGASQETKRNPINKVRMIKTTQKAGRQEGSCLEALRGLTQLLVEC